MSRKAFHTRAPPPVVEDDYDPRKPEYIAPAPSEEVEASQCNLLEKQISALESMLSRRRKKGTPEALLEHYERILQEMRQTWILQDAPGVTERKNVPQQQQRLQQQQVQSEKPVAPKEPAAARTNLVAAALPLPEDDYDPRRPEFIAPLSAEEVEASETLLLNQQMSALASMLAARRQRKGTPEALLEHYERTLEEMRKMAGMRDDDGQPGVARACTAPERLTEVLSMGGNREETIAEDDSH